MQIKLKVYIMLDKMIFYEIGLVVHYIFKA